VATAWLSLVLLHYFNPDGCDEWDLRGRPVIRAGMPVLIDEDLRFQDEHGPQHGLITWAHRVDPLTTKRSAAAMTTAADHTFSFLLRSAIPLVLAPPGQLRGRVGTEQRVGVAVTSVDSKCVRELRRDKPLHQCDVNQRRLGPFRRLLDHP